MNLALEFTGVVKRYRRVRALDGLDLKVPRGSIFGLVGSNGAGKTTAMAVAMGLLRPSGGHTDLLGEGPFHPARHAGRVALLPQDARLPPHMRVAELLRFYGGLQGLEGIALERMIDTLLDWVHLRERRAAPIRTLSHGMARRMAIAQAFLGMPELVLLDEPLNGLDPREAVRVRELIRGRRGRQAVVVSSHNLSDIEALCDHVAFVERGRLVRQDTLETITCRSRLLVVHFEPGALPLEALRAGLPEAVWELEEGTLRITFPASLTTAEINARVLPPLLQAGVRILSVHRGSELERAYLQASAGSEGTPAATG